LGLNPKHFGGKDNGGDDQDKLSSLRPGKGKGGDGKSKPKTAYFSFYLSSDVPPKEIVEAVSLEFSRVGTFLRVKELQHVNTDPDCFP
jgi:hypothetical protein